MPLEFTVTSHTEVLNSQDYVPGQAGALDIFEEDTVPTDFISIEAEDGVLRIIEPTERGGNGDPGKTDGDRTGQIFKIDHFEIPDEVLAAEVQNVRAIGTQADLETLRSRIDKKLAVHAASLDATEEHQRIGALKGVIVSGRGAVLHNLYNAFGIAAPAPVVLGLDGQVSGIATRIQGDVRNVIEDALDGVYDHIHAFTGRDFHSALWDQEEVRETWLAERAGATLRAGAPDVFSIGNVTFERYRTGVKAAAANGGAGFVAANQAQAFPVGARGLFGTYYGPPDVMGHENQEGMPRYAYSWAMANGKGLHLNSQMNALSICKKPETLRTLTI